MAHNGGFRAWTLREALDNYRLRKQNGTGSLRPAEENIMEMLRHANEKAPHAASIAIVDKENAAHDIHRIVENVELLLTVANCFAMRLVHEENGGRNFDLTNPSEAGKFVNATANALYEVMTTKMVGYLGSPRQNTFNYSKAVNGEQLHLEFLNELFAGFNLPQESLDVVASVLKASTSSLAASVEVEHLHLLHCVTVFYFEDNPARNCKEACVRVILLKIDKDSWNAVHDGPSTSHTDFSMNYVDEVWTMDTSLVEAYVQDMHEFSEEMADTAIHEIRRLTKPHATVKPGNL